MSQSSFKTSYNQSESSQKTLLLFGIKKWTYNLILFVVILLLLRYILWWFEPQHIPTNWSRTNFMFVNDVLFALLSFVIFVGYISTIGVWLSVWTMAKPTKQPLLPNLKVAFLTCYVPGKEPFSMLKSTLKAMLAVRYKHDTWVLDEGNDERVKALCHELGVRYFTRSSKPGFNEHAGPFRAKTKAGNHNAWRYFYENEYDIVAQIDMDHKPKPNFLEKTLGYFSDPSVAVVGSPEIYKNKQNWISKGASEQSSIFHHIMQTGYYGVNIPFLIGTSHIYRVKAMNSIGGYAPTIVEDHLTGMKLYAKGYKGVFVPNILAQGHGPLNWADYFNQQFRWSYGLFEILFKHTPFLFKHLKWSARIHYILSQMYYFTGVGVLVGIVLTFLYLAFGIQPTNMQLVEWLSYALPLFGAEQILQWYIYRLSINKKHTPILGLTGKFLNLGANIVYATAFVTFLFRRKIVYQVTTKDTKRQPAIVPLRVFRFHLVLLAVSLVGLFLSIVNNHPALMQRLWGMFAVVSMTLIITSNYLPFAFLMVKKVKNRSTRFAKTILVYPKMAITYLNEILF